MWVRSKLRPQYLSLAEWYLNPDLIRIKASGRDSGLECLSWRLEPHRRAPRWADAGISIRRRREGRKNQVGKIAKLAALAVVTSPLLLVGGCAGQSEIDSLRGDVSALRTDVDGLKSQGMASEEAATAAARQAEAAAAEARAAAEAAREAAAAAQAAADKADRVYRESLAK